MSRRNFILLLIVLIIIVGIILAFMFLSGTKGENIPDKGGTNFFSKFNPFAKDPDTPKEGVGENEEEIINEGVPDNPDIKLRKVSSMPVAGYGVFMKERFKAQTQEEILNLTENTEKKVKPTAPQTEFAPALRYVARATGYIYQTFADKLEERRFSSTLIPKIYEAHFGNKAESVVMRYLKNDAITIETFVGSLPKEVLGADSTDSNEVKGSFLPENITSLSVAPDMLNIFYLLDVNDSAIGTTAGILGDRKIQVFSSPFTEWLTEWPNQKMITLTTKPASRIPGYMYMIDPIKKNFVRVLGEVNGLTTLTSPSGKFVLYGNDNLSLGIYNISSKLTTDVPLRTLPEKCVWDKNDIAIFCSVPSFSITATFPDSWYSGEISFSDQIWKFNTITRTTELLVDPVTVEGGEDVDGIKLMLDRDENYLFFVNKKDSYLWELNLK